MLLYCLGFRSIGKRRWFSMVNSRIGVGVALETPASFFARSVEILEGIFLRNGSMALWSSYPSCLSTVSPFHAKQ